MRSASGAWIQMARSQSTVETTRLARIVVLGFTRLIAIVMLLVGGFYLANAVFLHWPFWPSRLTIDVQWNNGFTWIGYGLGWTVPGALLAIFSGPIAKWIVPAPRNECLACGYVIENLQSERCPECGAITGVITKTEASAHTDSTDSSENAS